MTSLAPATVLCIDDQETGLAIRKIFLETFGYRVLTACSGREGLRVAQANVVDAVVLDFRMPDMNGDAVARELRIRKPQLPILMLTGYVHDLPESTQQDVDSVITKGSPPTDLLEALKRVLGSSPCKPAPASVRDHIAEVRKQVQRVRDAAGDAAERKTAGHSHKAAARSV
jgi:CheY-like chemotaxis protein